MPDLGIFQVNFTRPSFICDIEDQTFTRTSSTDHRSKLFVCPLRCPSSYTAVNQGSGQIESTHERANEVQVQMTGNPVFIRVVWLRCSS